MQCNFPPFYGYVYMHLVNPHHPYDKEVLKKQVCWEWKEDKYAEAEESAAQTV